MEGSKIKYQNNINDNLFWAALNNEVKKYFLNCDNKAYLKGIIIAKTGFLFLVFFGSYGLIISNQFSPFSTLLLGVVCGLTSILIIFNISHDASHNCLFRSRKLNKILTYTINLLGGDEHVWSILHNNTHHAFINVAQTDPDVYHAAPYIRFSPSDPIKPYHKYQHIYATAIYSINSLYHIFIKDFMAYRILPNSAFSFPNCNPTMLSYVKLFVSKIVYLIYSLVIPIIVLDIFWWKIILGYVFIQILMGILLTFISIQVHITDWSDFPQTSKEHKINQSWVRSVFETTVDYSTGSKLINFFFGGFNTHLAHHLFPHICHVHLIEVTNIVKKKAPLYGFNYRSVSFWKAIKSHFRHLKKMGQQ